MKAINYIMKTIKNVVISILLFFSLLVYTLADNTPVFHVQSSTLTIPRIVVIDDFTGTRNVYTNVIIKELSYQVQKADFIHCQFLDTTGIKNEFSPVDPACLGIKLDK